jgi:hypothetical protein
MSSLYFVSEIYVFVCDTCSFVLISCYVLAGDLQRFYPELTFPFLFLNFPGVVINAHGDVS